MSGVAVGWPIVFDSNPPIFVKLFFCHGFFEFFEFPNFLCAYARVSSEKRGPETSFNVVDEGKLRLVKNFLSSGSIADSSVNKRW